MELREFAIGESFWTPDGEFRCTDIGSRVITAIRLGPIEVVMVDDTGETLTHLDQDPNWFNGPPYSVEEIVFDEDDQQLCFRTEAEVPREPESVDPNAD